jgi:hypothetical protein
LFFNPNLDTDFLNLHKFYWSLVQILILSVHGQVALQIRQSVRWWHNENAELCFRPALPRLLVVFSNETFAVCGSLESATSYCAWLASCAILLDNEPIIWLIWSLLFSVILVKREKLPVFPKFAYSYFWDEFFLQISQIYKKNSHKVFSPIICSVAYMFFFSIFCPKFYHPEPSNLSSTKLLRVACPEQMMRLLNFLWVFCRPDYLGTSVLRAFLRLHPNRPQQRRSRVEPHFSPAFALKCLRTLIKMLKW